jgi:lysophospholipase L1-like esterase
MKTVLCFGDSITWGFEPGTGARLPFERRWPGVAQAVLSEGFLVVEEALNGRTTVTDSPFVDGRSGRAMLGPLLESHFPVDLVVILLGTNDLQIPLKLSASHAACGCWTLLDIVLRSQCGPGGSSPKSLLVAPPPLGAPAGFVGVFFEGGREESLKLAPLYAEMAAGVDCAFFDAGKVVQPSPVDGVHLDAAGHRKLGEALAAEIRKLLEPGGAP